MTDEASPNQHDKKGQTPEKSEEHTSIEKHVEVQLTQGNVDAICDFTYNLGNGAFIGSHLLVQINNKADQQTITNEFKKWIYVNHKPNDWQIKR